MDYPSQRVANCYFVFVAIILAGSLYTSCDQFHNINYTDDPPALTGGARISATECVKRMQQHIHEENIDKVMSAQIVVMCEVPSWLDFMTNR